MSDYLPYKRYTNVDIVVKERKEKADVTPKELADILESIDNVVIREALALVNTRNKNRIIGIAQCIHGVLYASYFKLSKYWGKDDE